MRTINQLGPVQPWKRFAAKLPVFLPPPLQSPSSTLAPENAKKKKIDKKGKEELTLKPQQKFKIRMRKRAPAGLVDNGFAPGQRIQFGNCVVAWLAADKKTA